MNTGKELVANVWGAVGSVVVLVAILAVVFTNFIGREKNIPRGIGLLVAVGFVAALAMAPDSVIAIGKTIMEIFGIGQSGGTKP